MKGELILSLVFLLDWGEVESQGWRFYHVHCTTQCLSADAQFRNGEMLRPLLEKASIL